MIDRRRFLVGAGALLTASFVNRAKAFSRRCGKPLVLSPARKPEETLYVYRQEIWSDYGGEWRVSLGPDQPFAHSGIPSKRTTTSSAFAVSMICLWKNSTST
jgi:hypothetical protein